VESEATKGADQRFGVPIVDDGDGQVDIAGEPDFAANAHGEAADERELAVDAAQDSPRLSEDFQR
jgi:hypothetical protein